MSRRYITQDPARPFSDAVLIDGKSLYLSGRIGLKPGTNQVPETIAEEVYALMNDLRQLLQAAEMTMDHLTFLQIFCPDVSLWGAFNEVYRQYFTGPMPPRSFIGSGPLLFGAHFELQGIAIRDTEQ